jgi:hypothetical protein
LHLRPISGIKRAAMELSGSSTVGGRFELVARIGAGSFGEVWRALDRATNRWVAVKRLHGHLDEAAAIARFVRESVALSRVQSSYVVGHVDHGTDEQGRPWLATEWIDGEDLAKIRRGHTADRRRMLEVMVDAAKGTEALHAAGLVHRDLKPSNVFVSRDGGEGRVVDLGVAHLIGGTALTDVGAILGTPAYMAPEQVRGEAVDLRADLWSLGVMLFELVAGETPFESAHAVAVLGRVLLDPAPPLASIDPEVPGRLAALVAALLDKDASRRPANAGEVVRELSAILQDPANASWLTRDPRREPSEAARSDPSSTYAAVRGERRWIAVLAARFDGTAPQGWLTACEAAGAQVERVRDATLVAFGLTSGRGDELQVAARIALGARAARGAAALVAGWTDVVGGSAIAGALIDRAAEVLDLAGRSEALVALEGAERLEETFDLEVREPGIARLMAARRHSVLLEEDRASHKVLGRVVAAVGREKELALLSALFAESVSERSARAALFIGEAGIGKTRLLSELRQRLKSDPAFPRWFIVRGDPMIADTPHAMLARALRMSAGADEVEGSGDAVLRWAESFSGHPLNDRTREGLLGLVDGVGPDDRLDPSEHRQREYEVLLTLLRGSLSMRPLIIAVEDLHWADRATVDTLGRLFADCADEAFVLLAVARPELSSRHPTLWRSMARTELRLAPLSERASEALVRAVIDLPPDERRALVRRAGGNPLFLEELVRARAAGLLTLPAAVHAVLQARLDALGPDVRRVAQAASVFGLTFWSEGVAALRGARSTGAALGALERAELVSLVPRSRLAHCTEYAFSHALARDAAYAMLVDAERRALHGRAAEWLSSCGERDPATLGQHLAAAGRAGEAASQFRSAAQQALSESAFADADAHCALGLAAEPDGPETVETLLLRASAREALGRPMEMLGDAERARDNPSANAMQVIRARSLCAGAQLAVGDLVSADRALRALLEETHATLVSARVQALVGLAEVDVASGRASEGDVLIDEALSWLDEAGEGFELLRLRARRGRALARVCAGDVAGALQEARASLRDAEVLRNRAAVAEGRTLLGSILVRAGEAVAAKVELERTRREVEAIAAPALRVAFESAWASSVTETESLVAARHVGERAAEVARECGRALFVQLAVIRVAMAEVLAGEPVRMELAQAPLGVLGGPWRSIQAAESLRRGALSSALAEAEGAMTELGPRAELLEGEAFVRWVHVRALLAAGRDRDGDAALLRAKERMERKARRLASVEARAQYVHGVAARRALERLWTERLR